MSARKRLLIVTDLDGSLLDDSYSWKAAQPALARLRHTGAPLVLNSSKTLAEMQSLSDALEVDSPIIAENGGLLAIRAESQLLQPSSLLRRSGEFFIRMTGLSREFILEKAHSLRNEHGYQFEGFADWSIDCVMLHTGLSEEDANRAMQRHVTEPILWQDTPQRLAEFELELAPKEIRILQGGRFLHLMGQADKADGLRATRQLYKEHFPEFEWLVVALGDSENDRSMLEAADIAVVLPHADGPHIFPNASRLIHANKPASDGWNEAILTIFDEYC